MQCKSSAQKCKDTSGRAACVALLQYLLLRKVQNAKPRESQYNPHATFQGSSMKSWRPGIFMRTRLSRSPPRSTHAFPNGVPNIPPKKYQGLIEVPKLSSLDLPLSSYFLRNCRITHFHPLVLRGQFAGPVCASSSENWAGLIELWIPA